MTTTTKRMSAKVRAGFEQEIAEIRALIEKSREMSAKAEALIAESEALLHKSTGFTQAEREAIDEVMVMEEPIIFRLEAKYRAMAEAEHANDREFTIDDYE